MVQSPPTNRDRLEEAGVLDGNRTLTEDQYLAIQSLTPTEVNCVISANQTLKNLVGAANIMLTMPGINPNPLAEIAIPPPTVKKKTKAKKTDKIGKRPRRRG